MGKLGCGSGYFPERHSVRNRIGKGGYHRTMQTHGEHPVNIGEHLMPPAGGEGGLELAAREGPQFAGGRLVGAVDLGGVHVGGDGVHLAIGIVH